MARDARDLWPARAAVELALACRVAAACAVQWIATRRGSRCLFPDTDIYWLLGRAIARGEPFEVSQWGLPHFALRTPGYPLLLAIGQMAFGDRAMPVRLVQAGLGAISVGLVYGLARAVLPEVRTRWPWATPAVIAAALAAVDPYAVGYSVVLLSEAAFVPLMLAGLWGLAVLWRPDGARESQASVVALLTGVAWGLAVLVKPSWALFPPLALGAWILAVRRVRPVLQASLVALGLSLVMLPWWVRNAELFGRFVPTALWSGASLYDGLNPRATGGSDMTFLGAPDLRVLDEEAQDAELSRRAVAYARSHPRHVLKLALAKAWRYWCPWPNPETTRSPLLIAVGALWGLPLYALIVRGVADRRRDLRALVVLAGPLLYFAAIHLVFASSSRYRMPGMMPALGLAGLGACRWLGPDHGGTAAPGCPTQEHGP
jgi:4-amino-4-deoxy-L-arabinose transferase-like glycosyltransferase